MSSKIYKKQFYRLQLRYKRFRCYGV